MQSGCANPTGNLAAAGLAFAAFVAGLEMASMPVIIVRVRGAEPAVASVAEDGGGFVAGLVEQGNSLAGGTYGFTRELAGRLCFHSGTPMARLYAPAACTNSVKFSFYPAAWRTW
jgi:hypothetical protein